MHLQSETGNAEPLGDLGFTLFFGRSLSHRLKQQWMFVKDIESDVRVTSEGNRASQHNL